MGVCGDREIVGEMGKVFAEEIAKDKVKSLRDSAEKKNLAQVTAMLGNSVNPCLPSDSVDLVYMNRVYHRFLLAFFCLLY